MRRRRLWFIQATALQLQWWFPPRLVRRFPGTTYVTHIVTTIVVTGIVMIEHIVTATGIQGTAMPLDTGIRGLMYTETVAACGLLPTGTVTRVVS